MKITKIFCLVLLLVLGYSLKAEESERKAGLFSYLFNPFEIRFFPGGQFYSSFLENYAPDTVFMTEESNAFALLDNPQVYFEGDPASHFNWYIDGFKNNSFMSAGGPAVQLPIRSIGSFQLVGENPLVDFSGLNIRSRGNEPDGIRVAVSSVYPDLGGYGPWAKIMLQPEHPSERADRLYDTRRSIRRNTFVDLGLNHELGNSRLKLGLNYFNLGRRFNDFASRDTTFDENGELLSAYSSLTRKLRSGALDLLALVNWKKRSHLDAELGRHPFETVGQNSLSLLTGVRFNHKKLEARLSFIHENEKLAENQPEPVKELVDNDGEGLFLNPRLGRFRSSQLALNLKHPFSLGTASDGSRLVPYLDLNLAALNGREDVYPEVGYTLNGNPYQVVTWQPGQAYSNSTSSASAGFLFQYNPSGSISLYGKLFLHYSFAGFANRANSLSLFKAGFDAGILLFKNRGAELLLAYGQTPYDFRSNVSWFLESERPSGQIHRWNDNNSDVLFDSGEVGRLIGYTGGSNHSAAENLVLPSRKRLLVNFSHRLSRRWMLNVKGLYKIIINPFRVSFNREFGHYETLDGQPFYFFDSAYGEYELSNRPYEKDPYYAQLMFRFQGREEGRWFFSLSFMAHIGMGVTAFGNGAGTSDIGIINESQANPNSWINGYGRLEGDRAFVGRLYYGFFLTRRLFLGMSLKYRDGTPFAFINTLNHNDQLVFYYQTIKAENEWGIKGGPREDYLADFSIKLSYPFKLFGNEAMLSASIFNLLDVGGELSEYVFSGGSRDAMELQIPRSLRLSLNWMF